MTKRMNSYYLSEINKIPLLTLEEETALATKAFSGDKSAQKKLVEHNLRFVIKIANQYQGFMDIEDLITEGNMGLMHAAEKFNPANHAKFSTYAAWWIRAYTQKAIREISTGIRFPPNKFAEMKKSKWNITSLDKTIGSDEDDETTLASLLKDERFVNLEDVYWEQELILQLNQLVKMLKKNEQTVIIKRYGLDGKDPLSLSEVGSVMGYSKERIRQLEKRALIELRKKLISSNVYAGLAA